MLIANGFLFVVFGLCFIAAPDFFFELFTGDVFNSASAVIDVRATYGGVCLGVGLWLFLSARATHVRPGLVGLIAVLACVVFGRIAGFLAGGDGANIVMYVSLAMEVGFLLVTVYALRKVAG